ncbi:MAG: hypothetical protein A2017_06560 [Lentisphaerae bacterium GWF2_44_16]|nr:MAG: hypothetical protein A2017_06560 [Lentisphaerae bacterium GWF2_44_16]
MNIYNLTKEAIGTMCKGNHVSIPASAGGVIGEASVSPKVADELLRRYPGSLTKNFDDARGGEVAGRNILFQKEKAELEEKLKQKESECGGLKKELEKKDSELNEYLLRNKNLQARIDELLKPPVAENKETAEDKKSKHASK